MEELYAPTNPKLEANRKLRNRLNAVAHLCYSHLSFLNEENAASVLDGTITILVDIERRAGREPRSMNGYIDYLITNHLHEKLNMLIKEVYLV